MRIQCRLMIVIAVILEQPSSAVPLLTEHIVVSGALPFTITAITLTGQHPGVGADVRSSQSDQLAN